MIVENNNWTLIEVNSPEEAAEAVKRVLQSNVPLLHAHWTSGKSAYSLYFCHMLEKLLQEVHIRPEADET